MSKHSLFAEPRGEQLFDEFTLLLDDMRDPFGFEAGDANLYRYVGNGPTNGTDPSGLMFVVSDPTSPDGQFHPPPPEQRPWPYLPPISPIEQERNAIYFDAVRWSELYRQKLKNGRAPGFPTEDCDIQSSMANTYLRGKPRKYWDIRPIEGGVYIRPGEMFDIPGQGIFNTIFGGIFGAIEHENAIGVFPKDGNPCKPWVIDVFHGYYNDGEGPRYMDWDAFWEHWPRRFDDGTPPNKHPPLVPGGPFVNPGLG